MFKRDINVYPPLMRKIIISKDKYFYDYKNHHLENIHFAISNTTNRAIPFVIGENQNRVDDEHELVEDKNPCFSE